MRPEGSNLEPEGNNLGPRGSNVESRGMRPRVIELLLAEHKALPECSKVGTGTKHCVLTRP